jgi:hypothetical protein
MSKKKPQWLLGLTCQKWEAVANDFKEGIRTVKVRQGLGKNVRFEKSKPILNTG